MLQGLELLFPEAGGKPLNGRTRLRSVFWAFSSWCLLVSVSDGDEDEKLRDGVSGQSGPSPACVVFAAILLSLFEDGY